jgi:hypothetical protein
MVHALEEVWRVLVSGGRLVDLRPIASNWPVEVLIDGRPTLAGKVDDSSRIPDDTASNNSITEAVRRGLFDKEREELFEYAYYWQTIDDMKAYVRDNWSGSAVLPEWVTAEARRLVMANPAQSKLRIRRKMMIARYRKLKQENPPSP